MYRYAEGEEVRLLYDVVSDGTYHGVPRGQPLVSAGATGFIMQAGVVLDDLVYDVHFLDIDRVVGCREPEIILASADWRPPHFAKGAVVHASVELHHRKETLALIGDPGVVTAVRYLPGQGYVYETRFENASDVALVFERQIEEGE